METSFSVRSTHDETVTIDRIETSCLCIDVGGVPIRLGPDESTELKVTFSPSDESDFEGRLSVRVTGYLADGGIGFQTTVNIEVDPRAE